MKKTLITMLSATIIFSGVSVGVSEKAFAGERSGISSVVEKEQTVAYDEETVLAGLEGTTIFALALLYKEGIVEVPEGYLASVVTNPETNQSFYKIEAEMQTFGLKKTAIVYAFRYGGKALGTVLDVVSDSTATYVKKNSGKIADAIDDASDLLYASIYQSLLSAGIPTFYARNIAWAIDTFLL